MACYFIALPGNTKTTNYSIGDYNWFKAFFSASFPNDPTCVNNAVTQYATDNTFARFWEVTAPSVELWEVAEQVAPSASSYNSGTGRWEREWNVRNMTQPELDALNAQRKQNNDNLRRFAYENEADPIFFKAQRAETPSQDWLDKIEEIRVLYPEPELITIPE